MNIAYFIYHGKIDEWDLFDLCIKSLQKVSDCKIVVFTPGLENHEYLENLGVQIVNFPMAKWEKRRMTCRVECTLEFPEAIGAKYGDNILSLDADVLFIKDPFDIFEKRQFDFFYTTRNISNEYAVNAGVWGYTYNEQSENLLKFQISNLNNPEWPPYVNARNHHVHDKCGLDWWGNQDFLCQMHHERESINNGSLGFDIKTIDAGPSYNWIYSGMDELDQIDHIKNKKSHVLHFKGSTSAGITSNRYLKETNEKQVKFYKLLLDLI